MSWIDTYFMLQTVGFWVIMGIIVLVGIAYTIYVIIEVQKGKPEKKKKRSRRNNDSRDE